ncbi:MAG: hypothetical protein Kilf2KO_25500 [Rhodospirillales bacterium]
MSHQQVQAQFSPPVWLHPDGTKVSCLEKIKVLNENLEELRQIAQDALEDGLLMGCDERQLRETLQGLMASLANPYSRHKTP